MLRQPAPEITVYAAVADVDVLSLGSLLSTMLRLTSAPSCVYYREVLPEPDESLEHPLRVHEAMHCEARSVRRCGDRAYARKFGEDEG